MKRTPAKVVSGYTRVYGTLSVSDGCFHMIPPAYVLEIAERTCLPYVMDNHTGMIGGDAFGDISGCVINPDNNITGLTSATNTRCKLKCDTGYQEMNFELTCRSGGGYPELYSDAWRNLVRTKTISTTEPMNCIAG